MLQAEPKSESAVPEPAAVAPLIEAPVVPEPPAVPVIEAPAPITAIQIESPPVELNAVLDSIPGSDAAAEALEDLTSVAGTITKHVMRHDC